MKKKKEFKLDWHRMQLEKSYFSLGFVLGILFDFLMVPRISGIIGTVVVFVIPLVFAGALSFAAKDGYDVARRFPKKSTPDA